MFYIKYTISFLFQLFSFCTQSIQNTQTPLKYLEGCEKAVSADSSCKNTRFKQYDILNRKFNDAFIELIMCLALFKVILWVY